MAVSQTSKPATGTDTVIIACNLPHGLCLRTFHEEVRSVPVPGGMLRDEKVFAPDEGEEFVVNGNAHPQNMAPVQTINHGYGITMGCPKALWDKWLKQNEKTNVVKGGFIFAVPSLSAMESETKNGRDIVTGLERIDPDNMPKGRVAVEKYKAA